MTRQEEHDHLLRCEGIVRLIVDICNVEGSNTFPISFDKDWGGNTLTVLFPDDHTHIGTESDALWENFVADFHNVLSRRLKKEQRKKPTKS